MSAGYSSLLSAAHIAKGFERLLEAADDLAIDAPQAKHMIATFLARAVIDEIVAPAFLNNPKVVSLGGEVIDHAKRMLRYGFFLPFHKFIPLTFGATAVTTVARSLSASGAQAMADRCKI